MGGTVWNTGGCASWYLDANGRNTTLWPDFTWRFRQRPAALRRRGLSARLTGPQQRLDLVLGEVRGLGRGDEVAQDVDEPARGRR